MGWRERALVAFHAEEAGRLKRQQDDETDRRNYFCNDMRGLVKRILGVDLPPEAVNIERGTVTVDGETMTRQTTTQGYGLVLQRPCPKCGAARETWPATDLAEMGSFLRDFDGIVQHDCPADPPSPDPEPPVPTAERQRGVRQAPSRGNVICPLITTDYGEATECRREVCALWLDRWGNCAVQAIGDAQAYWVDGAER